MIVFLLIVIICIMLFGGGAVAGFAGIAAAAIAAVLLCVWLGISVSAVLWVTGGILFVLIAIGLYAHATGHH